MKKTQWIELFHTIKNTAVPFTSIILFIMMSVALYTGMSWSAKSIGLSIEKDFFDFSMHDMEIFYPLGITNEQLTDIKAKSGASDIEGLYLAYPQFMLDDTIYQGKVASLSSELDKPHHLKGTLPKQKGEVALEAAAAEKLGISIGDTVTFIHDDDGHAYDLKNILAGNDFDLSKEFFTDDGMKYLACDTFTVTATLEHPAFSGISDRSYGVEPIHGIPVNLLFFVTNDSFDEEAFSGYVDVIVSFDKLKGIDSLSDEFDAIYGGYYEGVMDALSKITDSDKDALLKFVDTLSNKDATSLDDISDILKNTGYDNLSDIIKQANYLKPVVSSRRYNSARNTMDVMAGIIAKMKLSISVMFLFVSMMVCFFNILRIVKSSEGLIGIKRAMGFKKSELLKSLIIYSVFTVCAGTLLGLFLARFLLEPIFVGTINSSFVTVNRVYYFSIKDAAIIFMLVMSGMLFVTFLSGNSTINKPVMKLLYGEEPKCGKSRFYEKSKLFSSMSLFSKTILNNCMNDKKRVLSTLFGIVGSTALLVCAFSVKASVDATFSHHFEAVELYNKLVFFDSALIGCTEEIGHVLDENGISYTAVYTSMGTLDSKKGDTSYISLKVILDDKFSDFIKFNSTVKGKDDTSQIWLTKAISDYMGINVGDTVFYTDAQISNVAVPAENIMEYYMASQLILTEDAFYKYFGRRATPNTMLIKTDMDVDELTRLFADVRGFGYVSDYTETCNRSYNIISKVSLAIIAVFIVLSVCMSLLVLLNLLVLFVEDKKNELIILMINGYPRKKVRSYIYIDTILLTFLGILIGIFVGEYLGLIAAGSLSTQHSIAYKQISIKAAITGGAISAVFSYITAKIALRRIDDFKLSDIS